MSEKRAKMSSDDGAYVLNASMTAEKMPGGA